MNCGEDHTAPECKDPWTKEKISVHFMAIPDRIEGNRGTKANVEVIVLHLDS